MISHDSLAQELRERALCAIVIGGSAGSIEALRSLLLALGAPNVPVLVVIHISADASGEWQRVFVNSQFPVREAEDKESAAPGVVFVAPPNYHLLVGADGLLALSLDAPVQLSRPSIDVLFESAAWAYLDRVLGIVLSGANADGAVGLAAIHRAGGLCWVQAPDGAAAPAMPLAALHAVPDARVLTIDQMMEVFRAVA